MMGRRPNDPFWHDSCIAIIGIIYTPMTIPRIHTLTHLNLSQNDTHLYYTTITTIHLKFTDTLLYHKAQITSNPTLSSIKVQ